MLWPTRESGVPSFNPRLVTERFTEATVDHLVAVVILCLPYRGRPFTTVPDRHLGDAPWRAFGRAL
jgi:hypothetical protein